MANRIFSFKVNQRNMHIYSYFKNFSQIDKFISWIEDDNRSDTFELEIKVNYSNTKWIELSHVKSNINNNDIHLLSIIDISEKKEKNKKIHLFASILEQLPICVIITNVSGKMEYVNKEFLKQTAFTKEEIIGKNPKMFKSGYTSSEEYEELWNKILNGETWSGVFKNKTKNADSHWMATTISPIYNENNELINFISLETNIDEKIVMEEALRKQEKIMLIQARHAAMGEMISMIAHQWRQPLSIISTITSNLQVKYDNNLLDLETDCQSLSEIMYTTKYLSETIDDFRNFFKKDKTLMYIHISSLIKKLLKLNKQIFTKENILVYVDDLSEKEISTYSNELLQVLINIVNNAIDILIKKNIEEKEIYINTYEQEEYLYIKVSDNAGGINEDNVNRIFEPYFTTKGPSSGTGLGLYIAQTIVEEHLSGKLTVQNNDKGAEFIIKIPNLTI